LFSNAPRGWLNVNVDVGGDVDVDVVGDGDVNVAVSVFTRRREHA
jgi:hypothetical protein